eukprot:COSAG02_NODE_2232_length_9428_cov_3.232286_1_plen_85_part_00
MGRQHYDAHSGNVEFVGSKQPQPCAKKNQRVSIFNPFTNKMARVSPYSAKAKKIYKYYIEELDYDPAWVAPKDLKFYGVLFLMN